MTRKGQAKTCNICNKLGHSKLSCPDRPDKDVKPPRKPRRKKNVVDKDAQQMTDQQPQETTDQQSQQATDQQPHQRINQRIAFQGSIRNKEVVEVQAPNQLSEHDHLTQLTRDLMDNEKNSDVIVEPSTEKNPGTISQSNMHDTTTERPWFQKLAPPPIPKGHAHFRSTWLMYHDPEGKKGVTTSQIKKMWVATSKARERSMDLPLSE
ncbi:hypothetical protein ACFE04_030174 [Oxalis oulophora]